jgi:hypothetical protein
LLRAWGFSFQIRLIGERISTLAVLESPNTLNIVKPRESQTWYAEVNNEYPVVADARISATLMSFGEFKGDSLNLTHLGENNRAAVQLMDRAGWR